MGLFTRAYDFFKMIRSAALWIPWVMVRFMVDLVWNRI